MVEMIMDVLWASGDPMIGNLFYSLKFYCVFLVYFVLSM